MKTLRNIPWRALAVLSAVLLFAFFALGCATWKKKPTPSTPVVTKQVQKDEKILGAATAIDVITAPTAVAEEVKVQTEVIREAVKEAPAADVAALTKSLEVRAAKAEERAEKAESKSNTAIRLTLFLVSGLISAAGVVIALTGSQIPLFGPKAGFAVASGGAAMFGMTIALDWCLKHPLWVGIGLAVIFASALGMMYANLHHSKTSQQ